MASDDSVRFAGGLLWNRGREIGAPGDMCCNARPMADDTHAGAGSVSQSLSEQQVGSRGDSFVSLSLATVIATYVLIAVGSLVRAAGAGLGCPDWPRCFGGWLPPTGAEQLPAGFDASQFNVVETWLEYANRLVGVTIGLFIFAALISAWRHHRRIREIFWPSLAAFLLVGFQGWLGGQVVAEELADDVLTAHMVLALVIVSILLYAHLCARFGPAQPVPTEQRRLGLLGAVVGALLLVQAGVGTRVRYLIDQLGETEIARADWLPLSWWPDIAHRQLSVIVLLAVGYLLWATGKRTPGHRGMRTWARVTAALIGAQIAVGLGLAYLAVPAPLQVMHLLLGSLTIGALTVFVFQAYRVAGDCPRTPTD